MQCLKETVNHLNLNYNIIPAAEVTTAERKKKMIKEVKMKFEDLPSYVKLCYPNKAKGGEVYKFGNVKPSGNPYAYTQEKQMVDHYGVCLRLSLIGNSSTFVRDDGTVWQVYMDVFETIEHITVER